MHKQDPPRQVQVETTWVTPLQIGLLALIHLD